VVRTGISARRNSGSPGQPACVWLIRHHANLSCRQQQRRYLDEPIRAESTNNGPHSRCVGERLELRRITIALDNRHAMGIPNHILTNLPARVRRR